MARTSSSSPSKAPKEPGRLKQMYQVFQMTTRYDKRAIWYLLASFVLPLVAGIGLGVLLSGANVVGLILYIVAGLLGGILLFLIVLGRRAERAAYSQIAGQPGAVGAVLKSSLRRGWTASEMPITVSPKTQDAVYRAVGRGGVALIGEGPQSRTRPMLEDQRKVVARILPNVPINFVFVGPDEDSTALHKLPAKLNSFKSALRKNEVLAVSNRLNSLGKNGLPIPKGMDPMKARAPRPR
ncbi:hypothetical protein M2152_001238 [Microbacteriaceae bacterium SG_E_30_P1]|uniref:DUF4191 domain-containing protein n=1 Tax=Antiquaquibacter oligotrophicus TaxID=2880260 RepID=A0ABT6KM12_9MICO|nr:DUF4191 domain-containing protein [Antiquaquibacter oligotrophicus]MDH6181056.1 hypothetical protein [Antiquaquibacter oligotrophicus]UDF13246.1 DUF4191 domain-containing protein [Antiquaquibacter oligotrophicus]